MILCKLVYGVGFNDADYEVREGKYVQGKLVYSWVCPFYQTWLNMLSRCYADNQKARTPSYKGVCICEEWLTFSNFKSWMELQDWVGNELDKDLFGNGEEYSPSHCCFISKQMNLAISSYRKGSGVSYLPKRDVWRAYCYDPTTKKQVSLGTHNKKEDALEAAKNGRIKSYKEKILNHLDDPHLVKEKFIEYLGDLV